MPRSFIPKVKLAAALLAALMLGNATGSEALNLKVMDQIEIDLTNFAHCFDYATLAGKSISFTCGGKVSTQIDQGATGKMVSLSGRWRVQCPDGSHVYSAPYTYTLTLSGSADHDHPVLFSRNPCPNLPSQTTSFGGGVSQTTYTGQGITTYSIRLISLWR